MTRTSEEAKKGKTPQQLSEMMSKVARDRWKKATPEYKKEWGKKLQEFKKNKNLKK